MHKIVALFLFLGAVFSMQAAPQVESVVILGGGMGALTSALYLGRAELSPLVIEGKLPGGLLTQSHSVQNWPGEMEIEGAELAERMRSQAESNGARFLGEEVVSVDFSRRPFKIKTRTFLGKKGEREILAQSCIIAMGTEPNYLGVPGETGAKGYWGKGVTNCAICDGNLYRDQVVGVVGGGDAAVLEALYLSNIAKEVFVFVRKEKLRAGEQKRIAALLSKPNIKVMYKTQVTEVKGDGNKVTAVDLKSQGKKISDFQLDGLFLAIGSKPNTKIFKGSLALDEKGYIVVKDGQQTSVEGVYAVGDIVDPIFKQAVSAAGDGAKAALQAQQFVSDRINGLAAVEPPKAKEATAQIKAEVIEIRSLDQFEREIEESGCLVLVDFYASWCGPCKRISPLLEVAAGKLSGKVKFLKVNVEKLHALTDSYEIRAMPTALLFDRGGNVIQRKVGLGPIAGLLESLEESE